VAELVDAAGRAKEVSVKVTGSNPVLTAKIKNMSKHSIQNDPEIQQWIENSRIEYLMKSEAIEFGIFLTNNVEFEDFWSMDRLIQEKIYSIFIDSKNK
jgi:hypothetical protein